MTLVEEWRDLGRRNRRSSAFSTSPETGASAGRRSRSWARRAAWAFAGTGLQNGSTFGLYGIEIDARSPHSPPRTQVLANIPDLFGPGYTAEMTYYEHWSGARVFSAGARLRRPGAPLARHRSAAGELLAAARRLTPPERVRPPPGSTSAEPRRRALGHPPAGISTAAHATDPPVVAEQPRGEIACQHPFRGSVRCSRSPRSSLFRPSPQPATSSSCRPPRSTSPPIPRRR